MKAVGGPLAGKDLGVPFLKRSVGEATVASRYVAFGGKWLHAGGEGMSTKAVYNAWWCMKG